MLNRLDAASNDIGHLHARARSLSPAATLERGYAIVTRPDGAIVRSADDVSVGAVLDIRLSEGRLRAQTLAGDDGSGN